MSDPLPWELPGNAAQPKEPGLAVDVERCIGCHACSIACKTVHDVPLGTFRMRVRWLPRRDPPGIAFLPLFAADTCDLGEAARAHGRAPECVRACPTAALRYGDRADPIGAFARFEADHSARPFPGRATVHPAVRYVGLKPWMATEVRQGVPLDPADPDIIYEQGNRQ